MATDSQAKSTSLRQIVATVDKVVAITARRVGVEPSPGPSLPAGMSWDTSCVTPLCPRRRRCARFRIRLVIASL